MNLINVRDWVITLISNNCHRFLFSALNIFLTYNPYFEVGKKKKKKTKIGPEFILKKLIFLPQCIDPRRKKNHLMVLTCTD